MAEIIKRLLDAPNVDAASEVFNAQSKVEFAAFLAELRTLATPPASAPLAWGLLNANGDAWDFTANPDVADRWRSLHGGDRVVPLCAHPAPRGRVVVTKAMVEALRTAVELLEDAALSDEGLDGQDAADGAKKCRAALALVDADAPEVDRG